MSDFPAVKKALDAAVSSAIAAGKNPDIYTILQGLTKDVPGYTKWSLAQSPPAFQQLTAAQALSQLQSTKYSDLGSVLKLTDSLQDFQPIPLVQSTDTAYFVQFRPTALATKTGSASSAPVHPYFLAITQAAASAEAAPATSAAPVRLPHIVYPVGGIFQRDIRPASALSAEEREALSTKAELIDARPLRETNYALVLDVVSTGNPLWMVYNRNPYNDLAGEPVSSDPKALPPFFPFIGTNYDSAQVVTAIQNWSITPPKPTLADFQKLVQATGKVGAVSTSTVTIADVNKAFSGSAAPAAA